MTVESDADRATFVDADDFGVAVTWSRDGVPSTFSAQFSRPSRLIEGLGEVDMVDREARLICRTIDLPTGAAEDDPVAIAGESASFLCRAIRPTGDGMAFIELARAA